ncbi:MAG: hypothetical protein IPG96_16290 [Proteobacteria bacterium]|nr:hypothetical protein [Pseudomonadota bacterium]
MHALRGGRVYLGPQPNELCGLRACAAGTEQTAPGTATTPPTCSPCSAGSYCAGSTTPPSPCAAGTWDHDGSAATACVAKTTCNAGQYVGSEGTPTADRSCSACPNGTFSAQANAASCASWTTCAAGSYVANEGSATGDRTCATCAAGTDTSGPNEARCLPTSACDAGTEQTAPATAGAPPVCRACAAGAFCAGGTARPVTCAADSWDADGSAATPCAPKTTASPANLSPARARPRPTGSAPPAPAAPSVRANAASCTGWTNCVAGSYVSTDGTATGTASAPRARPTPSPPASTRPPVSRTGLRRGHRADGARYVHHAAHLRPLQRGQLLRRRHGARARLRRRHLGPRRQRCDGLRSQDHL